MKVTLLADENTSHRLIAACLQLEADFQLIHVSKWQGGKYRTCKDPALLMVLREAQRVLVGFDRSSMAFHAGRLTREGLGHAGVIIFRRSVGGKDYGHQARLLVNFWHEAREWDWANRIEYLPRS